MRCGRSSTPPGSRSCETQAGRGALVSEHPLSLGAVGATGTAAANRLARDADLVIGIGTRWSDFTTASKSAFQDPGVRFVNVNVAAFDAGKQSGLPVVARRAGRARAARRRRWPAIASIRRGRTVRGRRRATGLAEVARLTSLDGDQVAHRHRPK